MQVHVHDIVLFVVGMIGGGFLGVLFLCIVTISKGENANTQQIKAQRPYETD